MTACVIFANSANLFASTCAGLFARMFDTPYNVQLVLNGDSLELSGELQLWDPPANATHAVSLLWDDRLQDTNNVTLRYETLRTSAGGRHTAAWYAFGPTPAIGFETIDPAVGINNMRFVVNGKLEDQSGVGFVVHDDIVFAKTSCHNSGTTTGRFDVAVDVPPPSQPAQPTRNQTYYTIWSVNITNALNQYTIAAEVGGVTIQRNVPVSPFSFAAC
ncbi:hypothetical protein B0H16DRAFT_1731935 [Mycena metata]|uniref:Uncharacterized protein n=1 Tax=Mycena metata TaxID=1033252 RepID=A0AAD7I511_9AGAR|nr:hypothetical protein B0H16DRAFT_1731935 [Mycena metata]